MLARSGGPAYRYVSLPERGLRGLVSGDGNRKAPPYFGLKSSLSGRWPSSSAAHVAHTFTIRSPWTGPPLRTASRSVVASRSQFST